MKQLYFILIYFQLINSVSAQTPWMPVYTDMTYTFDECRIYNKQAVGLDWWTAWDEVEEFCFFSITVDSFAEVGSDTVWYLQKRTGKNDTLFNCPIAWYTHQSYQWYLDKPSFLQTEMVKKSNGEVYFYYPDTFLLLPQAQVNDSWVFSIKDSIVNAIVTDLQVMNVLGLPDSVKTIVLTTGDTILLSRNSGIIKFPFFDTNHTHRNLVGKQKDNFSSGIRIPDFWDFCNFEVGDEFMYKYRHDVMSNTYWYFYKNRVTSKTIIPEGYIYEIEWFGRTFNRSGSGIETIQYNKNSTKDLCHSNVEIDSSAYQHCMTLVIKDTLTQELSKLISYGPFSAPDSCFNKLGSSRYQIGLGLTFSSYSPDHTPEYFEIELVGHIKNGDTTGIIYSDSLLILLGNSEMANEENDFTLFPNPSNSGGLAVLKWTLALEKSLEVNVFNVVGQKIWSKGAEIGTLSLEIDVSAIPAGLYFLKIGDNTELLKWVIN